MEKGTQDGVDERDADAPDAPRVGVPTSPPSTGDGHAPVRPRLQRRGRQSSVRPLQHPPIILGPPSGPARGWLVLQTRARAREQPRHLREP